MHLSLENNLVLNKNSYIREPIKPKKNHFQKFTDETLFYMFYYMPKDSLQIYAADELCYRNWLYNKVNNLWFTNSNNEIIKDNLNIILDTYFHPFEWKKKEYNYFEYNQTDFVNPNAIAKFKNLLNH